MPASRPPIDARACDVMIPDVRHAGGLVEVMRLAQARREAGAGSSSPSFRKYVGGGPTNIACGEARLGLPPGDRDRVPKRSQQVKVEAG